MEFYMLWLSKIFNAQISDLMEFLKLISPKEAFSCSVQDLEDLGLPKDLIDSLTSLKIKDEAKFEFEFCKNQNISIIDITSEKYPFNLINSPQPPYLLYCKGTILPKDEVSISIVGSRNYSEYGKACTKKFAYELASCGITVVSGMAYGIDGFAHSYAISAKGRTIAVLGTGIDVIYPKENEKLYYEIIENGAVLSEFPFNTQPLPSNFPVRNRVVAGMSLGTLVIEANKKSGTMITARLAAEAGRNVYAIPGQIFSASAFGTNSLIKDGAKIVTSTEDILSDIYSEIKKIIPKPKQISLFDAPNLSEKENLVYKKLSLEPISIDEIVESLDMPVCEINSILAILELGGYIKCISGEKYAINVD